MKRTIIILLIACCKLGAVFAQNQIEQPTEEVFYNVEVPPSFIGGDQELFKYLATNIRYPLDARTNGIEGRVVVRFTVNKEGNIENAQVLKGIGYGCNEEALRLVIGMSGRWNPGKQGDKAVNTYFTLPIQFKVAIISR